MTNTESPPDSLLTKFLSLLERLAVGLVLPLKFAVRGFLPYLHYLIDSTARYVMYLVVATPVVLGLLFLASFLVGGPNAVFGSLTASSEVVNQWVTTISSNLHYTAIALALYYLVSAVLPYEPHDKHQRDYRRRNAPDGPYEWDALVAALIPAGAVATTFAIAYFAPGITKMIPYGILGVSVGSLAVATGPYVLARRSFKSGWDTDEGYPRELEIINWMASRLFILVGGVLVLVATGRPGAYFGLDATESLFVFTVVMMAYVVYHMRLTLYEDRDGFVNIRPNIRLWGALVRVPFAYSLIVVAFSGFSGADALGLPVFCTFTPLAAGLGYVGFRVIRTYPNLHAAYPRVKFDPDDYDVQEDIRRNSPVLSHEMKQSRLPKNRLWTELSRAERRIRAVNREANPQGLTPVSPLVISKLTYENDSSYDRRRKRILKARAGVKRLKREVEEADSDVESDDLLDEIETAIRHLNEAHELNEEVGETIIGRMNETLF